MDYKQFTKFLETRYSAEARRREGFSIAAWAREIGVGQVTIHRYIRQYDRKGGKVERDAVHTKVLQKLGGYFTARGDTEALRMIALYALGADPKQVQVDITITQTGDKS